MFKCHIREKHTGTGFKSVDFNRSDYLQAKAEILEEMKNNPNAIEGQLTDTGDYTASAKDRIFLKDEAGAISIMTFDSWSKRYGN